MYSHESISHVFRIQESRGLIGRLSPRQEIYPQDIEANDHKIAAFAIDTVRQVFDAGLFRDGGEIYTGDLGVLIVRRVDMKDMVVVAGDKIIPSGRVFRVEHLDHSIVTKIQFDTLKLGLITVTEPLPTGTLFIGSGGKTAPVMVAHELSPGNGMTAELFPVDSEGHRVTEGLVKYAGFMPIVLAGLAGRPRELGYGARYHGILVAPPHELATS